MSIPGIQRAHFFDEIVHHPNWKKSMTGENEPRVKQILESLGFAEDTDFTPQYPIGYAFVLDFAFVKEQLCLEVDGETHKQKKQLRKDKKRDAFLRDNNWCVIRILDEDLFDPYKKLFYKYLIKEVVLERRSQWEQGSLYPIDISYYNDEDYER
jgi:very-short-patch-repair endonuclease